MKYKLLLLIGYLLFVDSVSAQYDVSGLDLGKDVTNWFDHAIGKENLPIVSGSYQEVRNNSQLGHKFFESNQWAKININYFGQSYEQLFGLYDVMNDELILRHPTYTHYYAQPIKVQQDKIQGFEIKGHFFKYYQKTEAPVTGAGFYDQLFQGDHLTLIAQRKKEQTVSTNSTQMDYKVMDAYFLKYQGNYNKIKGRRSIIKTLINYKKPLRKFIRQHLLQIKAGNDEDLIALLDYCENLMAN